ncbi:MAG: DUF2252 domain-containing protein [Stigonema ocellatum SAG 48.90 = DSM 106950]|nr:DUF2252 domain-containing protein [Stigonema ocellatum SAG 48.90 = DSM 106950]
MNVHQNSGSIISSPTARLSFGKALRSTVPRCAHSEWNPPASRPDPIALLETSNQGRLPNLIPIRYGRMLKSPFTFLRGAAIIMAADLATTPTTGIEVQACGDCHVLNFGGYGTPERNLVFDLNDFDETLRAPWEWDIKRLATSVVVALRNIKVSEKNCFEAARAAAHSYRENMGKYAEMSALEVWYSRIDADVLRNFAHHAKHLQRIDHYVEKAQTRTSAHALPKLTEVVHGQWRIIDNPPLMYHLPPHDFLEQEVESAYQYYRQTLRDDLRVLLDRYHLVDIAMKVVGVGSVGTRCVVALLMGDDNEPLFLQMKEARASVLEPYAGKSIYQNHGQRIIAGQRIMQAASDIFLGWTHSEGGHDFYVRQLRDMKIGVDIEELSSSEFIHYSALCGWALARAHARSGDPVTISGYLGKSDTFEEAIAHFAVAYASQTEHDYKALVAAVKSGRIKAIEEDS